MNVAPIFRIKLISIFCAVSLLVLLFWAKKELSRERHYYSSLKSVDVILPDSVPSINQASVDLAMALFSIDKYPEMLPPKLDKNLEHRGITSKQGMNDMVEVAIGPAAFTSWGLLGSTLAHEVEVHVKQSFFLIWLLDELGLDGTGIAERQAYGFELDHARRFSLGNEDKFSINDTMNFYYPIEHGMAAKSQKTAGRLLSMP